MVTQLVNKFPAFKEIEVSYQLPKVHHPHTLSVCLSVWY